jgi:hypothetical protein
MLQQVIPGCLVAKFTGSVGDMDKWPIFLHSSSSSTSRYKLSVGLVYLPVKSLVTILDYTSTQSLVRWFFRRCAQCLPILFIFRIPFFFEPNFDAHIKPLDAARRLQNEDTDKETVAVSDRLPIVYGDFLMNKVGSNFSSGTGRYDA